MLMPFKLYLRFYCSTLHESFLCGLFIASLFYFNGHIDIYHCIFYCYLDLHALKLSDLSSPINLHALQFCFPFSENGPIVFSISETRIRGFILYLNVLLNSLPKQYSFNNQELQPLYSAASYLYYLEYS